MKPSLNWLFAFIPAALALDYASASDPVIFFAAALAIIPIAGMIVRATEQLATRTGDAVGGLLNATFGNFPELIIATVALKAGLFDMVRASIIGAILANLLLALGIAFLLGGLRKDQDYNPAAARMYSSMMLIAVISMILPSAFSRFLAPGETIRAEAQLNFGLALVLLVTYGLYLVFMLKTHAATFAAAGGGHSAHDSEGPRWSLPRAVGTLLGVSVLAALMSEVLVGAAEGTGHALGMTQAFIGIVFVAIVGGAAESGSAMAMGRKNRMDLALGIALGSSIQIALFVAPFLVLISHVIAPQPLELSFNRAETGSLFMAVLLGAIIAGDGRSNWYKGVQLITVYVLIALMFYLLPEMGAVTHETAP